MRYDLGPRSQVRHSLASEVTFYVRRIPGLGVDTLSQNEKRPRNKKAEDFLLCFFPAGTLPRYLANSGLLKRAFGSGASAQRRSAGANHGIGHRAERAHTCGVLGLRVSPSRVR